MPLGERGDGRAWPAAPRAGRRAPRRAARPRVDGQRRRVERLLGAVGQRQRRSRRRVEARRARHQRRVVDVEVGEPPLVEAQHVAPVGRRQPIEPAEERAARSPSWRDLRALVDEPPLAIDADARAAQPLDELGVGCMPTRSARTARGRELRARLGDADRRRRSAVQLVLRAQLLFLETSCARPARPGSATGGVPARPAAARARRAAPSTRTISTDADPSPRGSSPCASRRVRRVR